MAFYRDWDLEAVRPTLDVDTTNDGEVQMASANASAYYHRDFSWEELRDRAQQEVDAKPVMEPGKVAKILGRNGLDSNWQSFYKIHDNACVYKPRRYIPMIWPQLTSAEVNNVLELGAGYGSTLLPLLQLCKSLHAVATDFSVTALDRLCEHPLFDAKRCRTAVLDMGAGKVEDVIEPGSMDAVLLIFSLSAVEPGRHASALQQAALALRPGGYVFFRDYGMYDLSMLRSKQRIEGDLYARQDGTLAYFFRIERFAELADMAGLDVEMNEYHTVANVNRKEGLRLERVFITSTLRKPVVPT